MRMQAYHGTDLECAEKILTGQYSFYPNDEHWLGNGVYFFLDYSLAEWWTTNPSSTFGSRVKIPSIIQVAIELPPLHNMLDLRKLSDYKEFCELYFDEYLPLVQQEVFDISEINLKKMRCSFCDYLKYTYDLKAIIGNFSSTRQRYLAKEHQRLHKVLELYYMETQLCVFDLACIHDKHIIKL